MPRLLAIVVAAVLLLSNSATAQQRQNRSSVVSEVERWLNTLSNDLDHLEEDLYYERGSYPRGLRDQIEEVSEAVAHFQAVLRRESDVDHLKRDFREMDEQIHALINTLERSNDRWLRRQAARIQYSHEQIHFTFERRAGRVSRELLARHAHTLENQARTLEELSGRVSRRDRELRESIARFADEAEHFHDVIEEGADGDHLRDDFAELDETWHDVVDLLNRSYYAFYLRTAANNVNRVHNQIHDLLNVEHQHDHEPVSTSPPPQRVPQRRPAIEFEIPGIGRFQIPQ